jgi:hypothetical protein
LELVADLPKALITLQEAVGLEAMEVVAYRPFGGLGHEAPGVQVLHPPVADDLGAHRA